MLFLILAAAFFVIWLALVITSYTLSGMAHLLLGVAIVFIVVHFMRGRRRAV
jgi:hypothetical protein